MRRWFVAMVGLLLVLTGVQGVAADEFDALVEKIDPPARFADHKPQFSVDRREFTFQHYQKKITWAFYVVMDHDRHVALIPEQGFHAGTIYVQDFRPTHAPKQLDMPTERWHIDTARGCELQTQAYMPDDFGQTAASFRFDVSKDKSRLTMVRHFKGTATYNRWAHRDKQPQRVDATNTFVFRVDPVLGYVIDGTYDIKAERFPKRYQFTSVAQSGRYSVWPGEETCFRNICTPIGEEGYKGYYMNQPSIIRGRLSCRDGGFAGYLNDETGWSFITTVDGGNAPIGVCNAHADLDLTTVIPKDLQADSDGLKHWVQKHRALAAPPEVTKYLWDSMQVLFEGQRRMEIRLGKVEDFEDQPLPMTTRERGLAFTGNDPPLSDGIARSGEKALIVNGHLWPNIPQVNLQPGVKYHMEAWVKVEKWSDEKLKQREADLKARHERSRERLEENIAKYEKEIADAKAKGKTPDKRTTDRLAKAKAQLAAWQPFEGIGQQEAYIKGDFYEWSPHSGPMLTRQRTSVATPGKEDWQKIELDFVAPDWGPFINIVFAADNCTAYMDDFVLAPVSE